VPMHRSRGRAWAALFLLLAVGGLALTIQLGGGVLAQEKPAIFSTADVLLARVSQVTGLPVKDPVQKQLISRAEIRTYLAQSLHAEYTPQELHVQEASLQAFGLVPPDFNLEEFLLGFYSEQAAGFYDPRRKTLFLTADLPPEMQTLVLAHELTHALQDQHFDLQKFLRAERANDDATNARQALAEGHAMATAVQILIQPLELSSLPDLGPIMAKTLQQQTGSFPAFSSAPAFLRVQVVFPYLEGVDFVRTLVAQGGWQKANDAFRQPPATTQEIFEPKVYLGTKPLAKLELPQPPPLAQLPGLVILTENVLGQLGYYGLLDQLISEDEAKAVAPHWVADRYIIYERKPAGAASAPAPDSRGYVLVARVRWARPEAAQTFFRDYQTILWKKYTELTSDPRSGRDLFLGSAAQGSLMLLRKGNECLWVEGVPTTEAEAMLNWLRSL